MHLHFGAPPRDPDFRPERDGWTKLREPDPIVLQVIATPFAILNLAILLAAWFGLAWKVRLPSRAALKQTNTESL